VKKKRGSEKKTTLPGKKKGSFRTPSEKAEAQVLKRRGTNIIQNYEGTAVWHSLAGQKTEAEKKVLEGRLQDHGHSQWSADGDLGVCKMLDEGLGNKLKGGFVYDISANGLRARKGGRRKAKAGLLFKAAWQIL